MRILCVNTQNSRNGEDTLCITQVIYMRILYVYTQNRSSGMDILRMYADIPYVDFVRLY